MSGTRRGSRPPARGLKQRLRSARRRRPSSTRWLERQLADPYVAAARREGWRSRAAYKLIELDRRFRLLRPGLAVVDLGAAPGGWSQVAARRVGAVVAVDMVEMDPVPGVAFLLADVGGPGLDQRLREALGGGADLVLCDMAAPATGHRATDHLRAMALAERAYRVARRLLKPGGGFVVKVLRGGADHELLTPLRRDFARLRHAKPEASRRDSRETYLVAAGFRGEGRGD